MRKKKLYVVGYDSDEDVVCGENYRENKDSCLPITAKEAKRELKYYYGDTAVIYKLVPVAPENI